VYTRTLALNVLEAKYECTRTLALKVLIGKDLLLSKQFSSQSPHSYHNHSNNICAAFVFIANVCKAIPCGRPIFMDTFKVCVFLLQVNQDWGSPL
jgi:hypothetical protein